MENFDNVSVGTNNNFYYTVDLLVMQEIKLLSNKTSDPKRTCEMIKKYMGLQVYHQYKMRDLYGKSANF